MILTILGSGTAIPLPYRASPSLMINVDGEILILDIGPGTIRQLSRVGVHNSAIDHILISHFHPDHTADLVHFLFVTRNPTIFDKRGPFTVSGADGLKDLIRNIQKAYDRWLDMPEDKMTIEEFSSRKKQTTEYGKYTVTSFPIEHTASSLAYRIQDKNGKSLVYSGDTGFCEEIISFARGTDLLVLECAMPEGSELVGHLTPSLAGRVASMAGTKKLVLVHFYPEVLSTDIAGGCRKYYNGELLIGRDMLQVNI